MQEKIKKFVAFLPDKKNVRTAHIYIIQLFKGERVNG